MNVEETQEKKLFDELLPHFKNNCKEQTEREMDGELNSTGLNQKISVCRRVSTVEIVYQEYQDSKGKKYYKVYVNFKPKEKNYTNSLLNMQLLSCFETAFDAENFYTGITAQYC